jgi:hypothetical protein
MKNSPGLAPTLCLAVAGVEAALAVAVCELLFKGILPATERCGNNSPSCGNNRRGVKCAGHSSGFIGDHLAVEQDAACARLLEPGD